METVATEVQSVLFHETGLDPVELDPVKPIDPPSRDRWDSGLY